MRGAYFGFSINPCRVDRRRKEEEEVNRIQFLGFRMNV